MKFDDVQKIFYQHIHRRYHRFCREFFAQLMCVYLNIKSAYLFDLFPFSIKQLRNLLNDLSFHSLILKYSLNDLIILNSSQIGEIINSSVILIDLTTMMTTDSHLMLDKVLVFSKSIFYLLLLIRFGNICLGLIVKIQILMMK